MKVFTRDYRITGEYPTPFSGYTAGLRPCVFDIETSGIDSSRSRVILTAMLTMTENGVRITQFLAENHYEEGKVLNATCDFMKRENIGYLITFNGASFDLPFYNKRADVNFEEEIRLYNFDLYRFLRGNTDLAHRIGSLSQKSLENYYGIASDRQDTISGRESIALFDEYSMSGNSTLEKIILTHNREDVLQLHRLMFLSLDEPEDFDSAIAKYGFPVLDGSYTVRPSLVKGKKMLRICGDQIKNPVSAAYFPDFGSPLTSVFNAETALYEIDAPAGRLDDDFYIDADALGLGLSDDPDCVNGFVVLSPRTINLVSAKIAESVIRGMRL